jgi:hemolysin-activating ACP:hemolysin acyltransferase
MQHVSVTSDFTELSGLNVPALIASGDTPFADWLHFHQLSVDTIVNCIAHIESGHLRLNVDEHPVDEHAGDQGDVAAWCGFASLEIALSMAICSSLADGLGIETDMISDFLRATRWSSVPEGDLPHTIDHGAGHPPEIRMSWQGTISDLMCLAHEVAHAVQLQLSAGSFMPPVARETCAFLGELALIDWARRNQTDLATKLLQVWREENQLYCGDDCDLLRAALADPESAYSYRMNYPLARAAAVVMWRSRTDLQRLFRAGSEAMAILPIVVIADVASLSQNYLPPLPLPDTDQPAVDAYRALGAMALLDIDFWKGVSERRIEDYYATLLHHLQNRTAFIALDEVRRPAGYATWRNADGDNTVTLTRQVAPFGDHLLLQKALERHLGQESDVLALHSRSARQQQVAL